jgi:energy-coupling factor transporter transmembrane protein EcfT
MIIGSFRNSEQMAIALEARGFGAPGVQRTYLNVIRMRALDWAIVAIGLLSAVALLALNIQYGFGADLVSIFS